MKRTELTFGSLAENLALDEALLEQAEGRPKGAEVLRVWEAREPAVVVGRSSRVAEEVDVAACARRGISIFRRCSGGAAVVLGPGCLMYSVVLSYALRPQLRMIEQAHRFVLGVVEAALSERISGIRMQGISDLTRGPRKFSGNSLRCKRHHLLYHGTLLYAFPIPLIEGCLRAAPRQPAYRANRAHAEFVENLPLPADELRGALIRQWGAQEALVDQPLGRTRELAQQKYSDRQWTFRR